MDTRINVKTTDDIDEGTTNKYFTDARVNALRDTIDIMKKERNVTYQADIDTITTDTITKEKKIQIVEKGIDITMPNFYAVNTGENKLSI